MAYRMIARDTIEEKVVALTRRKAALFSGVMDDSDLSRVASPPKTSAGWSSGRAGDAPKRPRSSGQADGRGWRDAARRGQYEVTVRDRSGERCRSRRSGRTRR